jgi:hypothetical protein
MTTRTVPTAVPIDPTLEPFNALVGKWEIEATHPVFPETIVHGTAASTVESPPAARA